MKYKRQFMSGMFALALLAPGTSVFAADIPVTGSKMIQQTNQAKMKASSSGSIADAMDKNGKDLETKDDRVKKVLTVKKHKKVHTKKVNTMSGTSTNPVVIPTR